MEPQNQAPIMTPPLAPHEEKSVGPAVGIIIIIFIIVLGGLYFWGQRLEMIAPATSDAPQEETVAADASAQAELMKIKLQGSGDDVSSMEADLNATNVDSLGNEMNSVDGEAQGSAQTQ